MTLFGTFIVFKHLKLSFAENEQKYACLALVPLYIVPLPFFQYLMAHFGTLMI